ncbi:MAG: PD-(D/E)XK nuclease family transposase [Mediterranea sp.]|jgi:hypothetical protein|nr:PD-(D/E)XK nuclease family transposase [Mediterranea sp.]
MKYLDPKSDMAFYRVFGEHPDLAMSFLNALLPLDPDQEIKEIEYLSPEMVPDNLLCKYSIVSVRCHDNWGQHAQLLGYEKFRDIISVEKTLIGSHERKGRAEGEAIEARGRAEGEKEAIHKIALSLIANGIPFDTISQSTGLPVEEIKN